MGLWAHGYVVTLPQERLWLPKVIRHCLQILCWLVKLIHMPLWPLSPGIAHDAAGLRVSQQYSAWVSSLQANLCSSAVSANRRLMSGP